MSAHCLSVAEAWSRIVRLLHAYHYPALESPGPSFRGSGIRKAFIAVAENRAARHRRYRSVSLSSQLARAPAHAFLEATGYRWFASSRLLRKMLPLPME